MNKNSAFGEGRVNFFMPQEELRNLAAASYNKATNKFLRPVLAALLVECALLDGGAQHTNGSVLDLFPADAVVRMAPYSPAVYLRAASLPDHKSAAAWSALFRANICEHHALPRLDETGMTPLFSPEALEATAAHMTAHDAEMPVGIIEYKDGKRVYVGEVTPK